jgi:hypothetical protein
MFPRVKFSCGADSNLGSSWSLAGSRLLKGLLPISAGFHRRRGRALSGWVGKLGRWQSLFRPASRSGPIVRRQITRYSARRDWSFMTGFFHLMHRVGPGRKRGRPFKALSSPRDILLQNPFNFGNGFWMGHQVVTGWNYLL